MAGITSAQAEAQLAAWLAASTAIAGNQSYTMPDGRQLTRADAQEARNMINFWDAKVKELSGSGAGVRIGRAVPL